MTKSNSRLRQQCSKLCNIVVGVLSLAPCYVRKKQVRDKGVPSSYHHGKAVSSLVDDCQTMHPPPALFRKGEDGRKKKREVLHLFRCYTHTHPARAGSTLKGKRKKKADTRRADGQNQRRGGGEQTDLRNQPTRRNGPDQNSAHT